MDVAERPGDSCPAFRRKQVNLRSRAGPRPDAGKGNGRTLAGDVLDGRPEAELSRARTLWFAMS
jgi:hypothetical protein